MGRSVRHAAGGARHRGVGAGLLPALPRRRHRPTRLVASAGRGARRWPARDRRQPKSAAQPADRFRHSHQGWHGRVAHRAGPRHRARYRFIVRFRSAEAGAGDMIALGRHRALADDAWSEQAARVAIEEIAADAIAQFDPDTFWPAHPSDDGAGDGNPSFYIGAAGVIWALDYLHRIGAVGVAGDFRPVFAKLLERTVTAFENNSPPDYAKHGSLLFGDMGAALLGMRLDPAPHLADLVYRRAEANTGLPIRELMWGMPGSMLAAVHMAAMTGESRWRGLFETQAARLLADLEDTPQGPLWTQDLYGAKDHWLGPVHGFAGNVIPLLQGWHWLTSAQQAHVADF